MVLRHRKEPRRFRVRRGAQGEPASEAHASSTFVSNKPLSSIGGFLGRLVACLLAPLVLLISTALLPFVVASSNESPIWRQTRVGHRGKDIQVLKFSTMNVVASGELRETWFGRLVRPLGLDEILQILSIAKGDMTWFGPRPLLRVDIDEIYINSVLTHTKPGFFSSRSLATGIGNRALQTGEVTVSEMIRYDLSDLQHWSFRYAFRLFIQTALMVMRGGASVEDGEASPEFTAAKGHSERRDK